MIDLSHPLLLLLVFAVVVFILYMLFRQNGGYYWLIKESKAENTTTVIEDVLKYLYHIEDKKQLASLTTTIDLFELKNINMMVLLDQMNRDKLIKVSAETISLEEKGRYYALRVIRTHRLWEKFLSEETGYDKTEWHSKAEKMEHLLDISQVRNLDIKLGNPRYDPHGDPIPTEAGEMIMVDSFSLIEAKPDSICKILHIEDEPEVIYKEILKIDLHIGSEILILKNEDSFMQINNEGNVCKIDKITANNIQVDYTETKEYNVVRLSNLKTEEKGVIVGISKECRGMARRRLLDLGFVVNSDISIGLVNPLDNPRAYLIKNTLIALRDDQASNILIRKV